MSSLRQINGASSSSSPWENVHTKITVVNISNEELCLNLIVYSMHVHDLKKIFFKTISCPLQPAQFYHPYDRKGFPTTQA